MPLLALDLLANLGFMTPASVRSSLKWCHTCGRSFNWRPSMSADWANVKYCSKTCRGKKPHSNNVDQGIERSFLSLLLSRHHDSVVVVEKRKVTCEEVQDYDGGDRSTATTISNNGVQWRERYRRAARRLANVQLLCDIEHSEKGENAWLPGDGKGKMRVWLKDGKVDDASKRLLELEDGRHVGQTKYTPRYTHAFIVY